MLRQPRSCFSRHHAPLRTSCWLSIARDRCALATLPPACLPQQGAQRVAGRVAGANGTSFMLPRNPSLLSHYLKDIKGMDLFITAPQRMLKIFPIKAHMSFSKHLLVSHANFTLFLNQSPIFLSVKVKF